MSQNRGSKIFINARFLTQPITGVQRFAIELSLYLKDLLPDIIFVSPKNILQTDLANQLEVKSFGKFTSHFWEQLELPLYLKEHDKPLLLNFCNTAPLLYKKNIVCIHDLAFNVNPRWFSTAFVALYTFLIPRIARKSLKILTVSEFSKESIVKFTGIPIDKVSVVYNGLTNAFVKPNNLELEPSTERIVLTVSSMDPRKNLVSLIKAFKKANLDGFKLIIVGSKSRVFSDIGLKDEILDCTSIIFTGYLPDNELATLYKKAHIFVYPSLYEGFGIPPLEAMASGIATIVSYVAALPEICGNASLYVNPLDIDDITAKLKLLAENENLRKELIQKGFDQIEKYSWEKSAQQVALLLIKYL